MAELKDADMTGWAKFADVISYSIGLKAWGDRRSADARAYAAITGAETNVKIDMIKLKGEEQIEEFIIAKESRKLNNVISVAEKAEAQFATDEKVSDEAVNQDWVNRVFSIIEDVSDEEMQNLWARILAGEIKQPKSYSLRTLDVLRNMTKEDADLFIKASAFCIGNDILCTEKFSLSLLETIKLSEIGLVNSTELTKTYTILSNADQALVISKSEFIKIFNSKDNDIKLKLSIKKLTSPGIELLKLISRANNKQFILDLATHLKSKGVSRIVQNAIIAWKGDSYNFYKNNEVEI